MKIPVIIPYTDNREIEEISKVVASGWVAQGAKVAEFESQVAAHEGIRNAIATTSCTTALHLVMSALGIELGQNVLVPSFTFVASANAIAHTGATPHFVDVLPETFCIDPISVERIIKEDYNEEKGRLVSKKNNNILRAIMVVHQFGLCADIPAIMAIAKKYNLLVIEDSACALGAKIGDNHQGTFGNPSCLSFHPRKSITTGEGGMILTDDDDLAEKLKVLRSHGASVNEIHRHNANNFLLPTFADIGYNYRMTDIQAAMGLVQMEKLDFILETRRLKAKRYNELLSDFEWLTTPIEPDAYYHTYQSYVCMLKHDGLRDELLTILAGKGIATRQGTHACHMLECYQTLYGMEAEELPNSNACNRLSLTLPLYVQMTVEEQDYVVNQLKEAYKCLV